MATERQIEANRINASRSSGPKSAEGKARSRANATKHGLAGELPEGEVAMSPEFLERRAKWAAEQKPVGEAGHWALDRVVAATFRIERCERAVEEVTATSRTRASLAWDEDRAVEAAAIAGRLARDPVLASRQLRTTLAGVGLLIEAWRGLVAALEVEDWSESEASRALDLLGVAPDLRSGRTLIDDPDEGGLVAYRRTLAFEEIERLESLRDESMAPLDEMDRRRALVGDLALLSKPAKLILRYERDAWRRYRESMAELQNPASGLASAPPTAIVQAPQPVIVQAPTPPEADDPLGWMDRDGDEDAWLDELERRIDALPELRGPAGPLATDRTQFVGLPVALGSAEVAGR
jgi:hypothetical protein